MHRSATSLVAEGMSKVMHWGGDVIVNPGVLNPGGWHESSVIINLNNMILKAAGGSKYNVPPLDNILAQGDLFTEEIIATINKL